MTVGSVVARPQQPADYRFQYGPHLYQFGDLRLPPGSGRKSVIVLLHGGCWSAAYGLHLMGGAAERLTELGYATWNVEFRRVGQRGVFWPATFRDVELAISYVDNLASRFNLAAASIVLMGHSSGGHLALWSAHSPEFLRGHPRLGIRGVLALAPVTNLVQSAVDEPQPCHEQVEGLMGGPYGGNEDRYHSASPVHMPATQVDVFVISGRRDEIVPVANVEAYVNASRDKGMEVRHLTLDGSGHFEMISPGTEAWDEIESAITRLAHSVARGDQ